MSLEQELLHWVWCLPHCVALRGPLPPRHWATLAAGGEGGLELAMEPGAQDKLENWVSHLVSQPTHCCSLKTSIIFAPFSDNKKQYGIIS